MHLRAASLPSLGRLAVCVLLEKDTVLLYNDMMTLDEKSARAARKRALAYEANMAVEGMVLRAEDKALADQLDAQAVGYEDGVERAIAHLKSHGVIPAGGDEPGDAK